MYRRESLQPIVEAIQSLGGGNGSGETTAQLNVRDTNNRNRDNHTGSQPISTIDGLESGLNSKQSTLISGINIKSINGETLLGSGNITISGGSGGNYATVAQGLLADTAVQPSGIANFETTTQLNVRDTNNRNRDNHTGSQAISTVVGLQTALDSKQSTLISGTNIKSINGEALLGSGNITIPSNYATVAQGLLADTAVQPSGLTPYALTSTVNAGLANKVDKVAGKGLSTEDYTSAEKTKLSQVSLTQSLIISISDENTNLTAGNNKTTFRMPYAFNLTNVRASVNTAPVGSILIVDINQNGVSILGNKLSIDANEKTSVTAATLPTITTAALSDDAEITIDIDQIGVTTPGKGLKVTLLGVQA